MGTQEAGQVINIIHYFLSHKFVTKEEQRMLVRTYNLEHNSSVKFKHVEDFMKLLYSSLPRARLTEGTPGILVSMEDWIYGLASNPTYQFFTDYSKKGRWLGIIGGDGAWENKDLGTTFLLVTLEWASSISGVAKSPKHGCTLALCRGGGNHSPTDADELEDLQEDPAEPTSILSRMDDVVCTCVSRLRCRVTRVRAYHTHGTRHVCAHLGIVRILTLGDHGVW